MPNFKNFTYEETVEYIEDFFYYLREDLKHTHRKRITLNDLNYELKQLYHYCDIDIKTFSAIIKDLGICLRNCVSYGTQERLKQVLIESTRSNTGESRLIIRNDDAKRFYYAKSCLIHVF